MTPLSHRAIVLTPPGTGAIAVIRLIGPDPVSILSKSFVHSQGRTPCPDGKLLYGKLMDGSDILDDVLVSVEKIAEHEQAVEISCHGGVRVVQRILELLERGGAAVETDQPSGLTRPILRVAWSSAAPPCGPGYMPAPDEAGLGHATPDPQFWSCQSTSSFSHWPAQNMIEEEAIEALLHSKTQRAARYAALLRTELPSRIRDILQQWEIDPTQARISIGKLMLGYTAATSLLRGITIALIGPPNCGKSTLFNALLGRQAVVTSPVPGTTRDWVMESVEIQGVPVNLVDTAGRRETDCGLEQHAIEASDSLLHKSSALLFVFDGSIPIPDGMFNLLRTTKRRRWAVANKADLGFCWDASDLERIKHASGSYPIQVSARSGVGCELLRHAVLVHFGLFNPVGPPLSFFTDRQADLTIKLSNRGNPPGQILASLFGDKLADTTGKAL